MNQTQSQNKTADGQSRAGEAGANLTDELAANWTLPAIAEAIEQAHMAGQWRNGAGCDPSAYDALVYRKRVMAANV